MLPHIGNVLQIPLKATEELADIFKNHGKESKPKIMGDFKMVVVDPNQKVDTPMEEGEIEELDTISERDLCQKEDMHKYMVDEKFNPKSIKSGSSVGYIDLDTVPYELKFAQIRMLRELMFNLIHLSRYNHLVGNGGLKVWAKWTTLTAVQWKTKISCPM